MESKKQTPSGIRNFGLDLLRASAILLVLFAHGNTIAKLPRLEGYKLSIEEIAGVFGVELFFILSGFLIGNIILKLHKKDRSIKSIPNFWIRRWFRTLPNYYLFLLISIVIFATKNSLTNQILKYPFFLQCFLFRSTPIMEESWSLCIEEYFYILFPVWLFLFPKKLKPRNASLLAITSFILTILLFRIYISETYTNRSWDYGFRCTTILRLDSIGFGVLLAWINLHYSTLLHAKRKQLATIGSFGIIASFLMLGTSKTYDNALFFSITSVSTSLIVPYFLHLDYKESLFKKATTHISLISYTLYLTHYSIVLKMLANLDTSPQLKYVIYIGISIFLSTLNYRYFESKITKLRERISNGEPKLEPQK